MYDLVMDTRRTAYSVTASATQRDTSGTISFTSWDFRQGVTSFQTMSFTGPSIPYNAVSDAGTTFNPTSWSDLVGNWVRVGDSISPSPDNFLLGDTERTGQATITITQSTGTAVCTSNSVLGAGVPNIRIDSVTSSTGTPNTASPTEVSAKSDELPDELNVAVLDELEPSVRVISMAPTPTLPNELSNESLDATSNEKNSPTKSPHVDGDTD